ncbi:MAG: hypothetical protein RBR09_01625 [Desulfobulbaceae bacterium]|jgi:hypothetical protein|nr:hypothetical protein [Desulfobulbaceae bacterium]MDY0349928.1 hypothetical protein [Desulfobulbaceae bacterium]
MNIRESVAARTVKITGDQAWDMLRRADEIAVARGITYIVLHPASDGREQVLNHCLGRTGTLRAPVLKINKRFLVGFNRNMYDAFLG